MARQKKAKPIWFKFYPADWSSDEAVKLMTAEEEGLFLRAICHGFLNNGIPSDLGRLMRALRATETEFERSWPIVAPLWAADPSDPARLRNARQERDRKEIGDYTRVKSKAGKASATARSTDAQQNSNTMHLSVEQSDSKTANRMAPPVGTSVEQTIPRVLNRSVNNTEAETENPLTPSLHRAETELLVGEFHRWIDLYPNQVKVDQAARCWISLVDKGEITTETLPELFAGLQRWKDSAQWADSDGKYIPAPHVFLMGSLRSENSGRLWKDHPPKSASAKSSGEKRSSAGTDPNAEWVPSWKEQAA